MRRSATRMTPEWSRDLVAKSHSIAGRGGCQNGVVGLLHPKHRRGGQLRKLGGQQGHKRPVSQCPAQRQHHNHGNTSALTASPRMEVQAESTASKWTPWTPTIGTPAPPQEVSGKPMIQVPIGRLSGWTFSLHLAQLTCGSTPKMPNTCGWRQGMEMEETLTALGFWKVGTMVNLGFPLSCLSRAAWSGKFNALLHTPRARDLSLSPRTWGFSKPPTEGIPLIWCCQARRVIWCG